MTGEKRQGTRETPTPEITTNLKRQKRRRTVIDLKRKGEVKNNETEFKETEVGGVRSRGNL